MVAKTHVGMFERFELYQQDPGKARQHGFLDEASYQEMKKTLPNDFRKIQVDPTSKALAENTAQRVIAVWQDALLGVRHSAEKHISLDGIGFVYSMRLSGLGVISGYSENPREGSKMDALASVMWALKRYSEGVVTLVDLERSLALYEGTQPLR